LSPHSLAVALSLSALLGANQAYSPAALPKTLPGPCDSALASQYQVSVLAALPGFLGHFTPLDSTATHRVATSLSPALCRRAALALTERDRQTGFAAAAPDSVAVVVVDDTLFYVVLRRDQPAGEWYPTSWFDHGWQWLAGLLL